jgi:GNAT superfamily N-acetyltransferase
MKQIVKARAGRKGGMKRVPKGFSSMSLEQRKAIAVEANRKRWQSDPSRIPIEANEISFRYEIEDHEPLIDRSDVNEPSAYATTIHGKILRSVDDAEGLQIGKIEAIRLELSEVVNDGYPVYDVFDHDGDAEVYYRLVDPKTGSFKDKYCDGDNGLDLLILDRLFIEEPYRGSGIGLLAMRALIRRFGGGCGVAALYANPFTYREDEPDRSGPEYKAGVKKLQSYYKKLGFKTVAGTEMMVMDLSTRQPEIKRYLRHDVRKEMDGRTDRTEAAADGEVVGRRGGADPAPDSKEATHSSLSGETHV